MATFEITGEWSGPISPAGDYTRICHREYTDRAALADEVNKLGAIQFTDGTMLFVRARRRTRADGKRQPERKSYSDLIRQCIRNGVSRVVDLPPKDGGPRS